MCPAHVLLDTSVHLARLSVVLNTLEPCEDLSHCTVPTKNCPAVPFRELTTRKKVCTCSVQMRFFFFSIFHFSLWLVDSLDVETTKIEANCALWLCLNLPYLLESS